MSHSLTSCPGEDGLISHVREVEKMLHDVQNDADEIKISALFRQLRKLQSLLLQLESVRLCFSVSCPSLSYCDQ